MIATTGFRNQATDPLKNRRRLNSNRLVFLVSLALVLAILNVITRLPWVETKSYRFRLDQRGEDTVEEFVKMELVQERAHSRPLVLDETRDEEQSNEPDTDSTEVVAQDDAGRESFNRLEVKEQVLEFAEKAPTIVGGLGSYYVNIEYPEEAIRDNIQGRLILRFVVSPTGRAHSVEVVQSLHPLCDSAAVRAVRLTTFAPGEQNGEPVSVRMSLPVTFRIVDPTQGQ